MECFTGLWSRHSAPATKSSSAWFIGGVEQQFIPPPNTSLYETIPANSCDHYFSELLVNNKSCDTQYSFEHIIQQSPDEIMANEDSEDLRKILKTKAEKHRSFYKNLTGSSDADIETLYASPEMARVICNSNNAADQNELALKSLSAVEQVNKCSFMTTSINGADPDAPLSEDEMLSSDSKRVSKRQRRTGVYEIGKLKEEKPLIFKSVRLLRDNYLAMLEKTTKNLRLNTAFNKEGAADDSKLNSPTKDIDESLLLPPPSGYCSSTASGTSDDERERDKNWYQKSTVERCGSSDSAMGQSDEEIHQTINSNWGERREELDEDCEVPYRQPVSSPYSPRGSVDHVKVPSKTLIEAKFVPLPLDRKCSDCISEPPGGFDESGQNISGLDSRRHSCFTDDGDEQPRCRYWRTPSVVVSDYSDDIMGLTLEDIEYIRNQRKETSSSPDSSLHSSCSNLNYCGSVISSLDSEYVFKKPFRKSSDCSTCSTLSGDEEPPESLLTPRQREPSGWRKLRNIVQWTPFFQIYKKQRYPWVQLAGHQGNFKAGPDQGTILKKLCAKEEKCFKVLMKDVLRPYVPEYKGLVASDDGESSYIQLQDLLGDFVTPCVMDCKIGVRTYLEEELAKAKEKPKLRKDMYEKMVQIDSNAPTDEEHKLKGVTKPRYMVWRETISSTATLGFRIEGIRKSDGTSSKDFKTTRSKEEVIKAFIDFTEGFPHAVPKYIQRLKAIKATLETSHFFNTHEVIGSSLLFVHDRYNANVWLIDFAKTISLPENVKINHSSKWKVGNHEDGYLIGVNNLISIFKTLLENQPVPISPPLSLPVPPEIQENT